MSWGVQSDLTGLRLPAKYFHPLPVLRTYSPACTDLMVVLSPTLLQFLQCIALLCISAAAPQAAGPDCANSPCIAQELRQVIWSEKQVFCRSEEPGGGSIATFPRTLEGVTRKTDSKRKRQRESRKEREAAAIRTRAEEVKRLKNLKVQEVQDTYDHPPTFSLLSNSVFVLCV